MLIRAYLPKFLTALFGGIFIAAGILTFGNGILFDRIFIGILIFTALVCRGNINVVSLVVILFLKLTWEEIAWIFQQDEYILKAILYSGVLSLAYYLRHDPITKLVFPAIILASAAEIYWFSIGYIAPKIYWHVVIILSDVILRYLIFSRVSFVEKFFPGSGESTNLDWVIYKLSAFSLGLQILMILEYLVRHVLDLQGLLFIYYSYPYAVQSIGTLALWSIFNESYRMLLPRLLKA